MPQRKPQQKKRMPLFRKVMAGIVLTIAALTATVSLARGMKHEIPGNCARYVRIEAKKFGNEYIGANAWDFARANRLIKRNPKGLTIAEIKRTVKPGDVIGFWYKNSKYNKQGRLYTHLGVVTKVNPLVIQHNFGNERMMTEDFLNQRIGSGTLKPIDIITPFRKGESTVKESKNLRIEGTNLKTDEKRKEYALPWKEEDFVPIPKKQRKT